MIRIGLIICVFWTSAAVAQSDDVKRKVVEAMKRECLVTQRRAPENKSLSNETLLAYCNCFGDHAFEILTYAEMEQTITKPVPDGIQKKMNVLGMACYNVAK